MLNLLKKIRDLFGVGRWLDKDTEPIQEARQQRLNKSAKIQTALEGAFVSQMNTIAKDEIAEVRQYKDQTVFGGSTQLPKRDEIDDMLIADDIKITNVKTGSGIVPTLLGLAAGAAAVYFGMPYLADPAKDAVETRVETVIEKEREVRDYEVESRVLPPN